MVEYKTLIDLEYFKKLIPSKYENVELLTYGKRGIIFKAKFQGKDVVIKMPRESSTASNTTILEAKYLSEVNKLDIGPKLIEFTNDFVVMDFISGITIDKWIEDATNEELLGMLSVLFHQLFALDKANLNKSEMTNPYKHIIIDEELMPTLIDFERCRFSLKPQNITQFSQYLTSKKILPILQNKNILLNPKKFKESINNYFKEKKQFNIIETLI